MDYAYDCICKSHTGACISWNKAKSNEAKGKEVQTDSPKVFVEGTMIPIESAALYAVEQELKRARALYPSQHSAHEGYAVLLEEVDEFWDEVKMKKLDYQKARTELIHVAAMALRTIMDVIDPELERRKVN